MNTLNKILSLCGLVLIIISSGQAQQWRDIVPLKSTRADVERLLGPNEDSYGVIYKLRDGNLFIEYSSGPCREDRKGGWNVPDGVVISYSFSSTNKPRLADLKLNLKRFRRVVNTHTAGVIYYINDEEGIMYEVQRGRVHSVEYYPHKGDKHLHCGDPD